MFLKNAWYVAAWSDDVADALQQVVMLNDRICIFRDSSGTVVALEDARPHRKLPLLRGRRIGDTVECGYHGLTFGVRGQCVRAPGKRGIPSNARVNAYPTHERYGLVWIWMGNPALADPSEIFDIPEFNDPLWGVNRG